jgi:hypothetical protein
MRYADLITRRHNAVVNRVKKAAEGKQSKATLDLIW